MRTAVAIKFDVRDWENGFWVSFRIPFTWDNWDAVIALPGSANIEVIKE